MTVSSGVVQRVQDWTQLMSAAGAQPGKRVVRTRRGGKLGEVNFEQQGRSVTRQRAHTFHPRRGGRWRPATRVTTMTYPADPRVDTYIDALPDWQRALCREVRDLVHVADPEVTETIKRTNRPYFICHGNICALLAAKDHVNVFLYDGAIVPDPEGIITAGHDNKTARTVTFRQGDTVNAPALTAMFRQIIANNRAGGWRTLKSKDLT